MRLGTVTTVLGALLTPSNRRGPSQDIETFSVSEGLGLVPQSSLFNKKIALEDRRKYRIVRKGEIAYNPFLLWTGAAGANLTSRDVAVSPAYVVLTPPTQDEGRYWHYFFRSKAFSTTISGLAKGTVTRRRVATLHDILNLSFEVPSADYRRQSSALLGLIENRVEMLGEINATLEAIAQALFKSWFVDFDPVRAKAEGLEPQGMDAANAALFPSELEDSELGPIPKGWYAGKIADVSDLNASKWTARKHPSTLNYIDLSGVHSNRIDPPAEFEFDEAPSRARHHLREGDTIMGTVRPGNRAFAYIHEPDANLTGSTGFAVLSPKAPHLSSFVYLAATRNDAIDRLANLADGGAYPAVRPSAVTDTPCVIPHDDVFPAFARISRPLLERIAQNSCTARMLTELRDTLLPRLISGKLRIPESAAAA